MARGKIIVVEGTDGSGKNTQRGLLVERLKGRGVSVDSISFPRYETPTGKIVGGPYLGKLEIDRTWFPEGPNAVDPKIASLFYAADRRYARDEILKIVGSGSHLILDRYVWSNMAHQGGKIEDDGERARMYDFLEKLEFDLLELPRPDLTFLLYVPVWKSLELIEERTKGDKSKLDGHEVNVGHLENAERAYLELAKRYNWIKMDCMDEKRLRPREEIHAGILSHLNL